MTPLERAARAICDEFGVDPDRIVTADDDIEVELGSPEHPAWVRYVGMARAVLSAVREPSETMVEKGSAKFRGIGLQTREAVEEAWHEMIDAVLEGGN